MVKKKWQEAANGIFMGCFLCTYFTAHPEMGIVGCFCYSVVCEKQKVGKEYLFSIWQVWGRQCVQISSIISDLMVTIVVITFSFTRKKIPSAVSLSPKINIEPEQFGHQVLLPDIFFWVVVEIQGIVSINILWLVEKVLSHIKARDVCHLLY